MVLFFAHRRRLVVILGVAVSGLGVFDRAVAEQSSEIRPFAPLPDVPIQNAQQVELGRMLFFDGRLSGDATISCASCHDPAKAFTDGLALSQGYPGTLYFRNAPSIINASLQDYFFWDGRLSGDDLPTLIRDHISEAHFMQADGRLVIERLRQVPEYEKWFQESFGGEPTYGHILNALATFVDSVRSRNVPFDRLLTGDRAALSPAAHHGFQLFQGKAGCVQCHNGPLLSDGQFHSLGLVSNPRVFTEPLRHITFRRFMRTLGVSEYATLRRDVGSFAVNKRARDRYLFRTPMLREISRTAPYMHDGSLATLDDVVRFYNDGAGPRADKDDRLRPLALTTSEQRELVEFLKSLTGDPLDFEPLEPPPYELLQISSTSVGDGSESTGDASEVQPTEESIPALAALPSMPIPKDNLVTPEKVELGRLLFFDDRLSGDVGTSCASCHDPRLGWGDGNALSRGYAGTQHWRNSQTTVNSGYLTKLFWAGEAQSMEAQANSAITGNLAGNGDPTMIEARLAQIPRYVEMFRDAFGCREPNYELVLKAIATFERSELVSDDSDYDEYLRGDDEALSEGAVRGLELFRGKANCTGCHNGPLLTDERYHNLGVPQHPLFHEDPLRQASLRYQHFIRGVPEPVYRTANRDLGLYYTTKRASDRGKFRTPPLRYLMYTAPYMHNGVFETLEEVIDFYDEGGGDDPDKTPLLEPLGLTDDEKFDLVELLEAMSGDEVWAQPPDLPPYEVLDSK